MGRGREHQRLQRGALLRLEGDGVSVERGKQLRFRLRKTDEVDAARLAGYGYRFGDVLEAWSAPPKSAVLLEPLLVQRLERFIHAWGIHPARDAVSLQPLEAQTEQLRCALEAVEEQIRVLVCSG